MQYKVNEYIAIGLYKLGVKPNCTIFIDEETVSFGYGEADSVGLFDFQIPFEVYCEKII